MKFTLQSGYIQCFLTFKKYEHILSKQYVLVLHTLCIFIPVLTSYPSPFLIHTPLTLVCFFNLLSLFLCKPLGTLYWHQEREREGTVLSDSNPPLFGLLPSILALSLTTDATCNDSSDLFVLLLLYCLTSCMPSPTQMLNPFCIFFFFFPMRLPQTEIVTHKKQLLQ